jgi:hypothetical protein
MKQLLFTLLLLPVYCNAQLEVGVNTSITPLSNMANASGSIGSFSTESGELSYRINNIRVGLECDVAVIKYSNTHNITNEVEYYADPYTNLSCYVDRELRYDKFYWYFGGSLGYATLNGYYGQVVYQSYKEVSCGGHFGLGYDIYRGLRINAQAGITYLRGSFNYEVNSSYVVPVSLGLHYQFHSYKKKKKKAGLNMDRFM